ncbi:TMV resistance protein N-like [Camellia sinensis]|uniref:TMV resistance protein N-like n=1 Tax=Camellia sinensis TaxID=4442 RepID=UPI001036AADD|nr:TMV resistance protein N-like [Camellia sinensis]
MSLFLYPTGIDSRVKDINLWLQDGSNNIGIMVIYGMGGIGKTTIAKTAYNQNFERFDGSSFLANIRDTSKQPRGLVRLQKQLVSDIVKRKKEKLHNVDEGIIKIKHAMCCKRVLVVLDDVDQLDQLNAIFGMRDWFHPGSKIIITTRHKRMLKAYEAREIYKVTKLKDTEALSLRYRLLSANFLPLSRSYIHQIKNRLTHLTKESKSIEEYLNQIKELADQLALASSPIDEEDLVLLTLNDFPDEFNALKTTIRAWIEPISIV